MAVIQDMPAEIFRRILELGAENPKCFGFEARDLCSAALVARAWSQPAQELLVFEWWWPEPPRAIPDDLFHPPTHQLCEVMVDSCDSAAKARRLFERYGRLSLALFVCDDGYYDNVAASDVGYLLESGVQSFKAYGIMEGDFDFPEGTQLALESLGFRLEHSISPAQLQELVDKSPRLTRLDIWCDSDTLSTHGSTLLALAPHLRHLSILSPSSLPGDDASQFLRACTSITSLHLLNIRPGGLRELLSSVPVHLRLLVCYFLRRQSIDESVGDELLGALDQPALADLQRWRCVDGLVWGGWACPTRCEETSSRWAAACHARGIEPRGEERYYTD